ncbi:uncharacterized protein LOC130136254 [Syzygium oleosum]|uniref:uncharacterized protein LOC130136254 n=1 Tax=Syzygium oleosum TaxID=219896 RepID=UPI0024B9A597|nr:uncharacterized protein LOC130136254 [Syzygium oleosum]
MTWVKHTSVVWVDIELPLWQAYTYTAWMFKDGIDEFGPVRGFNVPFDGVGDWDPSAIPPPDGEMTSLETSLAQSGHQHAPVAPEPTVAKPDPEPEESQAGYDPIDVHLEVIPEEDPEEEEEDPEAKPEEAPEVEPEAEPEEEPEDVPEYEPWYDPEFVPEDESDEDPVEEERVDAPAKSDDINNPIDIEAEPESSEEPTVQGSSDAGDEESDCEWTPSRGRRG